MSSSKHPLLVAWEAANTRAKVVPGVRPVIIPEEGHRVSVALMDVNTGAYYEQTRPIHALHVGLRQWALLRKPKNPAKSAYNMARRLMDKGRIPAARWSPDAGLYVIPKCWLWPAAEKSGPKWSPK